jgi:hypothetical protein
MLINTTEAERMCLKWGKKYFNVILYSINFINVIDKHYVMSNKIL